MIPAFTKKAGPASVRFRRGLGVCLAGCVLALAAPADIDAMMARLAELGIRRPHPPANRLLAYPANLHFEWQRWIDEGVLDGAILRFFSLPFSSIFEDSIVQDMIARSQQRVQHDGRFSGFIFYEVASYLRFGPQPGECLVKYAPVQQAATAAC